MKTISVLLFLLIPFVGSAQSDFSQPFRECGVEGSITLYHLESGAWMFSDSLDARKETLPASTFKIINSAIALEIEVIADQHEIFTWDGRENNFFGTPIEAWNKDTDMKTAFAASVIWYYEELANRIGRENYEKYLTEVSYGNNDFSEQGDDFWNYGNFGISPVNQVLFLKDFYQNEGPFSSRTIRIVKELMISESVDQYTISGKTGWTKTDTKDIGWWIGYVEKEQDTWFFATRITNNLSDHNPNFSSCRTTITKQILVQLGII